MSKPGAGPSSAAASSSRPQLPINRELLTRFKPSKVFKDALDLTATTPDGFGPQITSLTFDDSGDKCVTAGEDEAFNLWDARLGKKIKTFNSKKYGVSHVRFTHRAVNILHASTKGDDHAIRYHSMHDNKYLSYFRGHTSRVRSLQMNPTDDTFVSAGDDGTVRSWDLRMPSCKGLLNDIGGSAVAAFDNTGVVLAVACSDTQTIALYDSSSMDANPFYHAPFIDSALSDISQPPPRPIITSLSFSNDGNYLLVGTSSDVHYILDAYELVILRRLVGHQGLERDRHGRKDIEPRRGSSGEEVGWIGDSRWVTSGSADGSICIWDLTPPPGEEKINALPLPFGSTSDDKFNQRAMTIEPAVRLQETAGTAHRPSRTVKFNPRTCMLAMGGEDLSFWLPVKDEEARIEEGW